MQYRLWQGISTLLRGLPLPFAYAIASIAGNAAYYLWPRGRTNTIANFRRVLPGAQEQFIRRTARASIVNYCKYLVDFARMPGATPEAILAAAHDSGRFEALDGVLEQGSGAIIVCMHFGNWDLGAAATAARGYPLAVVAEDFGDPRLTREITGAREQLGMRVLIEGRTTPSLVRSLRANGLLALLIDRPLERGGVLVDFFGAPVRLPEGPARLALKTGARLVPVAFPRVRPGGPDVEVLADFNVEHACTGTEEEQVAELTRQVLRVHEAYIRAQPDQWYMFRRMWPESGGI